MKIVRRKPNLSNPILAFLQRFETLEGYSVFHRRLSTAAHTHTHTNCYILPWLPVEAEKDFTQHSKKILLIPYNPKYLILKFLYGYPASGILDFTVSLFSGMNEGA